MCRAPYGARGLKYGGHGEDAEAGKSRPVWGAWIEISTGGGLDAMTRSRPVWGAWIEIVSEVNQFGGYEVAPRMGRVD